MPTLNERAHQLADTMAADADRLGIAVDTLDCGTRVIDCGVKAAGSIEAGRRLAEICMAGLGKVEIIPASSRELSAADICVTTEEPLAACMASQYAGWEIKADKYFAMGSGPMRAAAGKEELFDAIGLRERAPVCVGIVETSHVPTDSIASEIAAKCGVAPAQLTLLAARTASPAGTVQIVARSVETALHKLHELRFDLHRIAKGRGIAPLPPVAGDDPTAIGWTNDAILYGAAVTLGVRGGLEDLRDIGPRVPSCASPDYGRPFGEIFKSYGGDFYAIDPMLFSPAEILFSDAESLAEIRFGRLAPEVLHASFGARRSLMRYEK
jgi:methenyltetrahydromethanopterin cyclohydrolase